MIEYQLFIGVPVDNNISSALANLNTYIQETFINNESEYLHTTTTDTTTYLGKRIANEDTLHHCDLIEANVYSLLGKILPSYDFSTTQLLFIPIKHDS